VGGKVSSILYVSDQFDVPFALFPAKEPSVLTEQEVSWVRELRGRFGEDIMC